MNNDRLLIAVILIAIVVFTIFATEKIWFALLMTIFVSLAAGEWAGLVGLERQFCYLYQAAVFTLVVLIYLFSNTVMLYVLVFAGIIWWICSVVLVLFYQNGRNLIPSNQFIKSIMGILVLIPAWTSIVVLHERLPGGVKLVLFLLILVWLADTAAYFAGCRWGKTKLASHISPAKSWEGIAGAFLACTVFSAGYIFFSKLQGVSALLFLVLSLITIASSIFGDLLESLFKRLADKKDSGSLLLGHGGVLDRMDSLTAACPVFLTGIWLLEGKI